MSGLDTHYAWTDGAGSGRQAIVDHAIAFLDCHVKGARKSRLLQERQPAVTTFRRDGEFESSAIEESVLEDLVRLILGRDSAFLRRAPLAGLRRT